MAEICKSQVAQRLNMLLFYANGAQGNGQVQLLIQFKQMIDDCFPGTCLQVHDGGHSFEFVFKASNVKLHAIGQVHCIGQSVVGIQQ